MPQVGDKQESKVPLYLRRELTKQNSPTSACTSPLSPRNPVAHQCWGPWGSLLPRSPPDPRRWDPLPAQSVSAAQVWKWQRLHIKKRG